MIFSVANGGNQWTLHSATASVFLTVGDLVQEITLKSNEVLLPVWSMLLLDRQKI